MTLIVEDKTYMENISPVVHLVHLAPAVQSVSLILSVNR